MARENKLGSSFCSLGLEEDEEKALKSHLKEMGWSGKRYLRYLVRTDLKFKIKLKPNGPETRRKN
jgi:hypothetical protein